MNQKRYEQGENENAESGNMRSGSGYSLSCLRSEGAPAREASLFTLGHIQPRYFY
jgi:hypothetical protein